MKTKIIWFLYIVVGVLSLTVLNLLATERHTSLPDKRWDGTVVLPEMQVMPIDRDVLVVVIPERYRLPGQQDTYVKQEGDTLTERTEYNKLITTIVNRGDHFVGTLAGPHRDILQYYDSMIGRRLKPAVLDDPNSYQVKVNGEPVDLTILGRQSKPTDTAELHSAPNEKTNRAMPMEHRVYLKIPKSLVENDEVKVTAPNSLPKQKTWKPIKVPGELGLDGPESATTGFQFLETTRSPSVQVSQIGYRTDDPYKIAFVSAWLGSGGAYTFGERSFKILDQSSEKLVYEGTTTLTANETSSESVNNRNFSGTHVYQCEFSELKKPGTYVLTVEGIGSSFPFEIQNDIWLGAMKLTAKGLLNQRSGIEVGPPYVEYQRPRAFHPADGVKVYNSTITSFELHTIHKGNHKRFKELVARSTDEVLGDFAWGGYFDAGDWDRRTYHLTVSLDLLELFHLFPEKLEDISLGIPESDNHIPDVLDEVLFNVDFFKRMQTVEGGVRGGIESAEHPARGDRSWQESLKIIAFAPGAWSSYFYAGTAAQTYIALRKYDEERAKELLDSAVKAWQFAEKELPAVMEKYKQKPHQSLAGSRNLAALNLYRATGLSDYHDVFVKTTNIRNGEVGFGREWDTAVFTYAFMTEGGDTDLKQAARLRILDWADKVLAVSMRSGYGFGVKNQNLRIGWGDTVTPPSDLLARAHILTGDEKYLKGMIRTAMFGVGANSFNTTMTTGMGHQSPKRPLVCDTKRAQHHPEGITLYGPIDARRFKPYFLHHFESSVSPKHAKWPTAHLFWDMYIYVPINEFTVQQTMGPAFFGYGYLGLRD
ncbi:MAG: glycoside hydrolase family 9 protein [Verrucomicrobiota bacterium]